MEMSTQLKEDRSSSRRKSSLFPKVIFRNHNQGRLSYGALIPFKGTALKGRKLSIENNRRVVKHLRKKFDGIRGDRITTLNELPEVESEESKNGDETLDEDMNKQMKKNMPITPATSQLEILPRLQNGFVRSCSHQPNSAGTGVAELFLSRDQSLPAIVVDDHESSVISGSDHLSEASRRLSTPGIFVDWKSEPKSDDECVSVDDLFERRDILQLERCCPRTDEDLKRHSQVHHLMSVKAHLPLQRRKVRIFLSGGVDARDEQKLVLTKVFPRLSNLARSSNEPLEIVYANHRTTDGLLQSRGWEETSRSCISDAARESSGTAFVAFLFDESSEKISPPSTIPEEVMHKILHVAQLEAVASEAAIFHINSKHHLEDHVTKAISVPPKKVRFEVENSKDVDPPKPVTSRHLRKKIRKYQKTQRMLRRYYGLDLNAVPARFCFKGQKGAKELDKAAEECLLDILQRYSMRLESDTEVREWRKYNFLTPTENDIMWALNTTADPEANCLIFSRITENADLVSSSFEKLRLETKKRLGQNNLREYIITRKEMNKLKQGKSPKLIDSNLDYLEKLEFDIYNTVSLQMKRGAESSKADEENGVEDMIVIEHLRFLQSNCENFIGRAKTLQEMRKYIMSEYQSAPLAVFGEPGSGLSSIMSMAAMHSENWIQNKSNLLEMRFKGQNRDTAIIFRSVGVTAESRSPKLLLFSICSQLKRIEDLLQENGESQHSSGVKEIEMGGSQHLSAIFKLLLSSVTKHKIIVVIYIDNFNDTIDDKGKYSLSWIPKPLPKYVKMVLSFSIADGNLSPPASDQKAANMKEAFFKTYKEKTKIIIVPNLPVEKNMNPSMGGDATCVKTILQSFLQKHNRFLHEKQLSIVHKVARQTSSYLGVKFLACIVEHWHSFTPEKICIMEMKNWGSSLQDFCARFIEILRSKYDPNFFRSATCFLTCSRNGLTHQEIIDLVSRDTRVTQSVRTTSVFEKSPFVAAVSRRSTHQNATQITPSTMNRCEAVLEISSMWCHLREDLRSFLLETASDNTVTTKWRQRVFLKTIDEMYMKESGERQYYSKIMLSYFSNKAQECECGQVHDCGQPLHWISFTMRTLNCRRLSESLYHAMTCNDLESIKREMVFNIDWLMAKLEATSIETLIDEMYNVLLMKIDDSDLRLLMEALFLSYSSLARDPQQLPSQLLGRLHDTIEKDVPLAPEDPRKYPYTRNLLSQIRRSSYRFLMPTTTCLTSGKQVIYDPLHGHDDVITAITSCTDGQRILTASKDSTIKVWDVIERRAMRTIENVGSDVRFMCACMGNYYVAAIHKQNHVTLWDIVKGDEVLTVTDFSPDEEIAITVAGDGQLLAIVSKMSASVRVWDLDKASFHKKVRILPENGNCPDLSVARNGRGNNVLIGYRGHPDAIVVNVKRGKITRTLSCKHGRITFVETSREYYIVGCRRRQMEVHELQHFYLFDSINYGLIRIFKACADDTVFDIFVNRVGSHMIGLSTNGHGVEEVVVWSIESDSHRHMVQSNKRYVGGTCTDLQYCMTACEEESVVRIHNLAAQISKHDHSRTQIRKKVDGIGRLFNMPKHEKYVVAQGTSGSPITIWNVARSRCKGEAVIIERGLLDKNDVVVVKDVLVVILSDRGMVTINERSQQVFETIYVYNLLLRKYERKLNPVRVNMCNPDHYHVLGNDKLIATSAKRTSIMVWSIITGEVLNEITPSFPPTPVDDKSNVRWRNTRRRQRNRAVSDKASDNGLQKKRTNWKRCQVTKEEQKRVIFEMVASEDDKILVCSYYSRHLVVFDLAEGTHLHTLSDENSLLQLNKAILTPTGSFLLCTNYDDAAHSSYLTLWDLTEGCVSRRRKNEPKVCSISMTRDAKRIVFVTEGNYIKIWDPFQRRSHRSISGYPNIDVFPRDGDDSQPTTIYVVADGTRAILFANSLSVWDLEKEVLLMVFDPDTKFQCCTVALNGNVIVVGRRDSPSITTFRLPNSDGQTKSVWADEDLFGEKTESSDDESYTEEENSGVGP